MRILILEDDMDRMAAFRKKIAADHEIIHFTHPDDAFNYVVQNDKPMVCLLDHDLGINLTGYDFVRNVSTLQDKNRIGFIIHSMNNVGAAAMYRTLSNLWPTTILPGFFGYTADHINEMIARMIEEI